MLVDINKLFVDNAQLCFAFTPQENFPAHNFIFTEGDGDGIQSRLPFKFLYFITAISNFSCQNFLNGEFLEVQKLILPSKKLTFHRMIQILSKNPDDGTMWLLLIRRRLVNRFKIFKIMLGFENAQYLNVEGVELLPVTYFKLETLSHRSYITVDGELLDNEVKTVEAKIVPKSLSILTK